VSRAEAGFLCGVAHLVEDFGQNDGLLRLQGLHRVLPRGEPQQMPKGAAQGLHSTGETPHTGRWASARAAPTPETLATGECSGEARPRASGGHSRGGPRGGTWQP